MSNQMLPEAPSYLRLCCVVSSCRGHAAAAAAALTIRQVDAFTDVIGFASASLIAVLFLLVADYEAKCSDSRVLFDLVVQQEHNNNNNNNNNTFCRAP